MAMNSSGQISLAGTIAGQSIEIENGGNGTTQISLNDLAVRSLAGVATGAITMPTDFWGKSNISNISVDYNSNTANAVLNISQLSGYVAGKTKVTVNIGQDIYVYSTAVGNAGLNIGGGTSGDEIIINNHGFITGCGGGGGAGAHSPPAVSGNPGGSGGLAMNMTYPVSMYNYNTVAGGGGGGGGGKSDQQPGFVYKVNYGGGGGGGGRSVGPAGPGGYAEPQGSGDASPPGAPGGAGTLGAPGGGGGGGGAGATAGGAGGGWAATGTPSSAPGGAGGNAITKNGNQLTLFVQGVILGAVT